jgi:hypothetical protein
MENSMCPTAGGFKDMENSKMARKYLEIQMKKNKS